MLQMSSHSQLKQLVNHLQSLIQSVSLLTVPESSESLLSRMSSLTLSHPSSPADPSSTADPPSPADSSKVCLYVLI